MRSEGVLVLALVAGCGSEPEPAPVDPTQADALALARAARDRDPSAGTRACAIVRERAIDLRQPRIPELVSVAHAVLAETHTECPELAAALVDGACDPRLDCGPPDARRLCTPEDLLGPVQRVLDEIAAGREFPSDVDDRHLLLAAGHALPALPGRVRKQSERRRYRVVQPDGRPCIATPADHVEASCASTHSDEHEITAGCRVRVDDDRHELVVLQRPM